MPTDTRFTLCCFDGSGCKAPFKDQEIKRFLDKKTLENFEKLKTHHEIEKVRSVLRNANFRRPSKVWFIVRFAHMQPSWKIQPIGYSTV